MRLAVVVFVMLFVAATAYPRISKSRVNEDCQNELQVGLDSTGGNRSSLSFGSGVQACTDNLKRRWAFEGETLLIKSGTTNRSHKLEGAYDYRFAEGWLAILQASQEADNGDGLQSRVVVSPGVGVERFPDWGTVRVGAGFGRTWEDNRDAEPTSFSQAWSQAVVRWKVRPNISLREKLDAFLETRHEANYCYRADTDVEFRFGDHSSLASSIVYKWDHQPARNAARASWLTRTRFVFRWGGESR